MNSQDSLIDDSIRLRLSRVSERIITERVSVMLISADVSFLDRCGQELCRLLFSENRLTVTVLEDEPDKLPLDRFNQLLSNLSVEQARSIPSNRSSGHVWVMSVLTEDQLVATKSLGRMAHDFPGANLSLVLLVEPAFAQSIAKTRAGRAMMRCTLKLKDCVNTSPVPGRSGDVKDTGSRAFSREFSGDPEEKDVLASLRADGDVVQVAHQRQGARVVWIAAVLLLSSVALTFLLFYSSLSPSPSGSASIATAPGPVLAPAQNEAPRATEGAAENAPSKPPSEPREDVAPVVPVRESPGVQQPSPAAVNPQSVPENADPLAKRLEATRSWLSQAAPDTHTIQLVGTNDEKQLVGYLQRLVTLVDPESIRVYRTKAGGKDSFTVIFGSFATSREAGAARDALPAELRNSKPILRTVQGIRAELNL